MAERNRSDSPTKLCTLGGCNKPLRAKGMCATHYNRSKGEEWRHPKVLTACVVCRRLLRRRADSKYQPTCSVICRTVVQYGHRLAPTDSYQWKQDAAQRARRAGVLVVQVFDRIDIFERDDWTCQGCALRCAAPDPFDRTAATVDHIVPLHHGGEHSKANAQTLCLSCNSAKQDRLGLAA